jgi:hypothetical protein
MADEKKEEQKDNEGGEPNEKYLEVLETLHNQKEENETLKTSLNNVVEEMKELRKKKTPEDKQEDKSDEDISNKIKEALLEDKKSSAKTNLEKAKAQFQKDFKAFHPENDKGGIKMNMIDQAFSRLNTSNHFSTEELYDDIVFAYKGIKSDGDSGEVISPYASTKKEEGTPKDTKPKEVKLSDSEIAFAKGMGVDPEKLRQRLSEKKGRE